MNSGNVEQLRQRLQAFGKEAEGNEALKQQLLADPEATLKAHGFSNEVAGQVALEMGSAGDVRGYQWDRCDLSCLVSYATTGTAGMASGLLCTDASA